MPTRIFAPGLPENPVVPTRGVLANLMDEAKDRRGHPDGTVAELEALGDSLISGPKGYMALGAFNARERIARRWTGCGFDKQLVFATFSAGQCFRETISLDDRYAATKAHNRGMAQFCGKDERLFGVGLLPLDDPDRAMAEEAGSRAGPGFEGDLDSAPPGRRPLARPQRPGPLLVDA